VQYIAVNAGWGGSPVYNLGPFQTSTAKLLVFRLGGTAKLPPPPPQPQAHDSAPAEPGSGLIELDMAKNADWLNDDSDGDKAAAEPKSDEI
jgi:hypothetical protein